MGIQEGLARDIGMESSRVQTESKPMGVLTSKEFHSFSS